MKFALSLVFAVSVGMAFADGNCGSCCGKGVYNAKAFDKKDAEFLAMANAMAMGNESKKMACCSSAKTKVSKKSAKACPDCAKHAKAAKKAHAH